MSRGRILYWSLLLAAHFASRLYALTRLPLFIDETDHLRRALWVAQGERLLNSWLIYGKGLAVWLLVPFVALAEDPLWAGRAALAAAGALGLWATHQAARRLFGPRVALAAAGLVIVLPLALVHDRLALSDGLLASFAALALLASVRLAQQASLANGLWLGLALAGGAFAKLSGLLLAATPLLLLPGLRGWRRLPWRPLALGFALAAALLAYPLWRFFQTPRVLELAVGIRDGEAGLAAAFGLQLSRNLRLAAEWLDVYWTLPVVLAALVGLGESLRRRRPGGAALALLAVGPVLAFAVVSRLWFPRYLTLTTPPLAILAGLGLVAAADALGAHLPRVRAAALPALLLLAALPSLRFDLQLWQDPARAPWPRLDRFQYVRGWPSGYGVRESVAFFRTELEGSPEGITVAVHGPAHRATLQALGLYFAREPRLELRQLDLNDVAAARDELRALAAQCPTYLLVSRVHRSREQPRPARFGALLRARLITHKPGRVLCDEIFQVDPGAEPLPP